MDFNIAEDARLKSRHLLSSILNKLYGIRMKNLGSV